MRAKTTQNLEIQVKNQNELRELEQFYTDGKVDTMLQTIEQQKEELVNKMIEYANSHIKPYKWDREGNVIDTKVMLNPMVINNYFFKSIIPIGTREPVYNAEKLSMVFDYYCNILAEVNDKIGYFPPSLTSFCKMAGITMGTLRRYKNDADYSMRTIVEKIYDQICDENLTSSQLGMVKERSTIFRLKSQNEMIEKEQPKVNINITEKPDMERITARLSQYKDFASKKA